MTGKNRLKGLNMKGFETKAQKQVYLRFNTPIAGRVVDNLDRD